MSKDRDQFETHYLRSRKERRIRHFVDAIEDESPRSVRNAPEENPDDVKWNHRHTIEEQSGRMERMRFASDQGGKKDKE